LLDVSEDSHAVYYTADEYAAYLKDSQGEYAGIGVVLTMFEQRPTVLQVYADSPADEAGVKPGDMIIAIDGVRKDWDPATASEAIHRPVDESVEVIWQRAGRELTTTITVGAVNIPTVVSHLISVDDSQVGYVYLRRFNSASAAEVAAALAELEAAGAQSYVLDLRNNPGGYVDQAVELTSLFVSAGEVVRVEERSSTEAYRVTGERVTDKPLAVLVNANSASASELTAAALQDYQRATVVGETTFGKGTVQNVRFLSFGGAVRYTIAHYLSPAGQSVDGVGVTPDIVVAAADPDDQAEDGEGGEATEGTYHPSLEELLADTITSSGYRYRAGIDLQLDAALSAVSS
jgi:carboxyl-terminal processing protease